MRAWKRADTDASRVNEGELAVDEGIMKVAVAGDIRENVFGVLQRLVGVIKKDVVTEAELF